MELPELVESVADLDGDARLRVMYAYPNRFPWDLAKLLAEHPKVVPYLDIPIQHAATNGAARHATRGQRRSGPEDAGPPAW